MKQTPMGVFHPLQFFFHSASTGKMRGSEIAKSVTLNFILFALSIAYNSYS